MILINYFIIILFLNLTSNWLNLIDITIFKCLISRSILINGDPRDREQIYMESKPRHVCEEIPTTSTNPDVNKARDILQDVERYDNTV